MWTEEQAKVNLAWAAAAAPVSAYPALDEAKRWNYHHANRVYMKNAVALLMM
jgi:hypothetical protein